MSPILGIFSSAVEVAGTAFESIASTTGSGNPTSITFSSIPGTYQHLQLRYMASRNSSTSVLNVFIRFNSDTGSNYSRHYLKGNGSTVSASGAATQTRGYIGDALGASTLSDTFGVGIIDIHDYASTSKYKTVRALSGWDVNGATPNGEINLSSSLWQSTSAITSIELNFVGDAITSGSRFALYGIKG